MRVGAGARSCHAPSTGPAMQQDCFGAPGWEAPGRRGQETVQTQRVRPAETVTEVPKVLLRFTTQIPMFMTSLQSR